MDALAELALAIVAFIFEVTIHALVFVYLLLRAIFSPAYRRKLREHWDTSNWRRAGIVLGIGVYMAALVFALLVWTPLSWPGERRRAEEVDPWVDRTGRFIKRKLEERKDTGRPAGEDR